MTRRTFTGAGLAMLSTSSWAGPAASQEPRTYPVDRLTRTPLTFDDTLPPFPSGFPFGTEGKPDYTGPIEPDIPVGEDTPEALQFELAQIIVQSAPVACRPVDVARYFRNLTVGDSDTLSWIRQIWLGDRPDLHRQVGAHFGRGWTEVFNPIIAEFFRATTLEPRGDETDWCAAFVNWCIARSQLQHGTDYQLAEVLPRRLRQRGTSSALSGSFRCFGRCTDAPRYGDIVVWAKNGTLDGCTEGKGHVAFYVGEGEVPGGSQAGKEACTVELDLDGPSVPVLGGNQSSRTRPAAPTRPDSTLGTRSSAVTSTRFPRRYERGKMQLFGFRTAPFLRSAP